MKKPRAANLIGFSFSWGRGLPNKQKGIVLACAAERAGKQNAPQHEAGANQRPTRGALAECKRPARRVDNRREARGFRGNGMDWNAAFHGLKRDKRHAERIDLHGGAGKSGLDLRHGWRVTHRGIDHTNVIALDYDADNGFHGG